MSMILRIIFSFYLAPSFAAHSPEHFRIELSSGIREFHLYIPSDHPRGLVVMLHGCKTTASEFDQGTQMSQYGAEQNLAVLYPEQSMLFNVDRCWNWFWGSESEIIASGIRLVQKRFGIDRSRTVLMGMSAGAAQGAILAHCYRDLFSAALLHSGLQYLAATNLSDAQEALKHGSFTPFAEAAGIGYRCNSSTLPMKFMVVYGDLDQRVHPRNSLENAQELTELNRLLFVFRQQWDPSIQLIRENTPASESKLGFEETSILMNQEKIGSVIQVHGLEHEWSGGNPVQSRNNPKGPKVIEKFLSLFGV